MHWWFFLTGLRMIGSLQPNSVVLDPIWPHWPICTMNIFSTSKPISGATLLNCKCDSSNFCKIPWGHLFATGQALNLVRESGGSWWTNTKITNPAQEEIYFQLAKSTQNLVVVGDDDQAMYRFRGGSVECMVTFDHACEVFLGVPRANVARYTLVDNFRSHPSIVEFVNDYIGGFPVNECSECEGTETGNQTAAS